MPQRRPGKAPTALDDFHKDDGATLAARTALTALPIDFNFFLI
ncbi:MAG TPA: hypothetical protein VL178_09960 [Pseudomonas sp.]|jgi:hypothetical protein|nr:hypothetical protein [Pseudomonas sp.]